MRQVVCLLVAVSMCVCLLLGPPSPKPAAQPSTTPQVIPTTPPAPRPTGVLEVLTDDAARETLDEEWKAAQRLRDKRCLVESDTDRPQHVTSVTVDSKDVRDADLADLAKLPHLKRLVVVVHERWGLTSRQITNAAFATIGQLATLKTLEVRGLAIDDDACAHIGKLTALRVLDLANTRVSDDGLKHVARLTGLASLDLSGTRVSGEGLTTLAGSLTGLQKLGLRGVRLTTADLATVGTFVALEELDLPEAADSFASTVHPLYGPKRGPSSTAEPKGYEPVPAAELDYVAGAKHLAGLVRLKSVDMTRLFRRCPEGRTQFDGFKDAPWDEQPLADPGYGSAIDRFRRDVGTGAAKMTVAEAFREFFDLGRTGDGRLFVTSNRGKSLPLRTANPELAAFLERPRGQLLEHIRGWANVTSLDLSHFLITDDDLKLLAGHGRLERLDLSGQPVTRAGLEHLKHLPLRYLNLRGCALGDNDLDAVRAISTLRDVVLSQTRVTPKGTETFRRGTLKAVFDPKQMRPTWCDYDWHALVDGLPPPSAGR